METRGSCSVPARDGVVAAAPCPVPADDLRGRMLAHLHAGRDYQFLSHADPYLASAPEDHYVRLMAAREYLRLNLIQPAKELLDAAAHFSDAPGEFQQIGAMLRTVDGGVIPWTTMQARFDANVSALRKAKVEIEPILVAWERSRDSCQCFCDRNGVHQVRRRTPNGRWQWVPYLGHHRAVDDARRLPDGIDELTPGPFLFEGLDRGGYLERVHRKTQDTFLGFSCALFVVEPDTVNLAIVLHLSDWRTILSDERVFWFIGDGWRDGLRTVWDSDFDLPFPHLVLHIGIEPDRTGGAAAIVQRAGDERERRIRDSLADLERRYAARDKEHWARRFEEARAGQGAGLRILAAVSIHTSFLQHSMRDAQRALEALGHSCVVLTEKKPYTVTGPLTFHEAIRGLDPDVFFVLDHLRPEFEALIPKNLPVLTWDQDQLPQVFTAANMRSVARHDFLVGCSKSRWILNGGDPRQFLHARLPTCPEQFGGEELSPEEQARYACDVSYVSHAAQTPRQFHELEIASCANLRLAEIMNILYELLPAQLGRHRIATGFVADAMLEEACRRARVRIEDPEAVAWLKNWYIWRLGDRLFRHEALEWVARWARRTGRSFRIYGRGWKDHPTLREFAVGPAENGRELLCIYRASRINLQLMPAGFIHQRALDGLAAGGFFLSRLVPHDLQGRLLRTLLARMSSTPEVDGWQGQAQPGRGSDEVLNAADAELPALLNRYFGDFVDRAASAPPGLVNSLRLSGELLYPDEVFPSFGQIVFDSAEEFETKAERFLNFEADRERIAAEMRQAVLERFSYRAAMNQFLHAMAGYLNETETG